MRRVLGVLARSGACLRPTTSAPRAAGPWNLPVRAPPYSRSTPRLALLRPPSAPEQLALNTSPVYVYVVPHADPKLCPIVHIASALGQHTDPTYELFAEGFTHKPGQNYVSFATMVQRRYIAILQCAAVAIGMPALFAEKNLHEEARAGLVSGPISYRSHTTFRRPFRPTLTLTRRPPPTTQHWDSTHIHSNSQFVCVIDSWDVFLLSWHELLTKPLVGVDAAVYSSAGADELSSNPACAYLGALQTAPPGTC